MKTEPNHKTGYYFYVVTSLLVFVYLVLRAVLVPFVHDEAATFFNYVHIGNVFPRNITRESANNHYLNTLLTFISYRLFGSDKWALRLPNLLISLLYFRYAFKISKMLTSGLLRYGLFVALLFCFNLIDFFALSRGYGMSVAFLTAAIYYAVKFLKEGKSHFLIKSSLFTVLMLSANLATLIPAIALVAVHLATVLIFRRDEKGKIAFPVILLEIFVLVLAVALLLKLKNSGALYLGTPGGGFLNALKSWIILFSGGFSGIKLTVVTFFAAITFFYSLFALYYHPSKFFGSPAFVFGFVFWSSVAGSVVAANLFGVYYPENRVGLYFYPLFIPALFFAVDNFWVNKRYYFVLLPLVFIPLYSLFNINFVYAQDYKSEVVPERFYKRVFAGKTVEKDILPTIAGYHMETTMWGYLNYKNGGGANLIDWTQFPDTLQDYQLFDTTLYTGILKHYDIIDYESVSGLSLMKRKNSIKKKLFKTVEIDIQDKLSAKPFYNIWNIKNGFENKIFLFDIKLSVVSPRKPLHAWLVFQSVDKNGKSNIYKYIPLDWLKDNYDGKGFNLKQSFVSGKIPAGSKEVKLYIWNIDKSQVLLKGGTLNIYEIEQ